MNVRITEFRFKGDKQYSITKLMPDGRRKIMGVGRPMDLYLGASCIIGGWVTTSVQEITMVGKGVIIETLNSTYLIEEFEGDGSAFLDVSTDEN